MHRQQKSVSFCRLPFKAFSGAQLRSGRKETLGVGGSAQEGCGFFQRFVVFQRKYDGRQFSIVRNKIIRASWSSHTRSIALARVARTVVYVIASIVGLQICTCSCTSSGADCLAACRTSRIIKSQKTDAVLLHIGIMTRVPQQAGESV